MLLVSVFYPVTWRSAEDAFAKYDYARAVPAYQAALDLALETRNSRETARCYRALRLCSYRKGDMPEARATFQKGLAPARASGDVLIHAQLWRGIALAQHWSGDFQSSVKAESRP